MVAGTIRDRDEFEFALHLDCSLHEVEAVSRQCQPSFLVCAVLTQIILQKVYKYFVYNQRHVKL